MIEKLRELLEAYDAKVKAYEKCDTDPGYWCFNEAQRLEDAEKAFNGALIKIIDERVNENIKQVFSVAGRP